ncbi:MAG: response regulator transcription factor [Betaproteobacteria bacterium]|nr:response regulator transcription factor [Betaproteobacteria bacterium]MDE2048065.1 response regulator transcription factor [Betaproteobacteria bacterium]
MRLLLVEDDEELGAGIKAGLNLGGYVIDRVRTGADMEFALHSHHYDCVLLDLGLPDAQGGDLVRAMRKRKDHTPVVVITAQWQVENRIQVLDAGADDFLVKPFDLNELTARVRAVLRRVSISQEIKDLQHGPLWLHSRDRTALWHGELIPLSNKEFWLLESFLRHKGHILTRAQLEEALYGWGEEIESNTVEVYVHHLRKKFAPALITTVRGVGYQLGSEDALAACITPQMVTRG